MAKKDTSLSLEYILQKQQSEKLSGLSSTVKSQLGKVPTGGGMPSDNIILSELKKINTSLNVGLNNNIVKMTKAIENSTNLLAGFIKSSRKQLPPKTKNDLSQQDIEDKDYKEKSLKALIQLVNNTYPVKAKDVKGLGMWAGILAGVLGSIIGAMKGYLKGLKLILEQLTPEKFLVAIRKSFIRLAAFFEDLFTNSKNIFKKAFKPIGEFFSGALSKLKGLFSFSEDSKIVKTFKGISNWIGKFTKPFAEVFSIIKALVTGPVSAVKSIFTDIFKFLSKFANLFKFVGVLAQKIAIPITIIMGIFDTVSGALDGWKNTQGGVMNKLFGAIKGGLTGLVNGLFGGLLDLLKDGVSYVLDFFGAKGASKLLDSFKFTDIISNTISAIVDGFKDIIMYPITAFNALKDAYNGKIDWIDMLKTTMSAVIRMILAPVNTLAKIVGFDITKKALNLLGLPDTSSSSSDSKVKLDQTNNPPQVVTPPAYQANAIYEQSAQNEGAAMQQFAAPTNNIVNAPTTITKQTQNNLMKVNIRNQDTTIKDYYRSRFAS